MCRCDYHQHAGWKPVQRDVKIDYDLENAPLYIKTDSEVGSGDLVSVYFLTALKEDAGGVSLIFKPTPKYVLDFCSSRTSLAKFSTDLPSATDKIWKITLKRSETDGAITLMIHCNDVEVLNMPIDESCEDADWSTYWSKDVEKIEFSSDDVASDFYTSLPPGSSNS